jgi:putative transposase
MPRANRQFIPGLNWHITHRCHNRKFLLRFARDRQRWLYWLFEAKKRYGLKILNYALTSNHIHLLLQDVSHKTVTSASMDLIAGRTAQEYNQRKKRRGAYWEDRYHATAIESGSHLIRCMIYIDLNMVRAGVVKHPKEWPFCGFNEIQNPRQRYRIIHWPSLELHFDMKNREELKQYYRECVENVLRKEGLDRDGRWSESVAVGSKEYVERTALDLGIKAKNRKVEEFILGEEDSKMRTWILHEEEGTYSCVFDPRKGL